LTSQEKKVRKKQMKKAVKSVKTVKDVLVIARYVVKATGYVVYRVRSSNGVDEYCTTLDASGKATGCTCPSIKPCYHMTGCEALEAQRRAANTASTANADAERRRTAPLQGVNRNGGFRLLK